MPDNDYLPDEEQMEAYLSDLDDHIDATLETWSEDIEARKAVLLAMRDRLNQRIAELA